eukprot:scaffold72679_cov30-Phaeocystis_antarctica.AAC.1
MKSSQGYHGLDITAAYGSISSSRIPRYLPVKTAEAQIKFLYRPHHTRALTSTQHSGTGIHTDTRPLTSAVRGAASNLSP